MARTASPMGMRLLLHPEARIDRWRTLNRIARALAAADAAVGPGEDLRAHAAQRRPAWRASPCPLGWC